MSTKKVELVILVCLILGAIVSSINVADIQAQDPRVHVYFLNIGQGDATLITTPNGNQVLIDGGPTSKVLQELGRVMPFSDSSLDAIITTHTDADHLTGLADVLERYDVEAIIETGMQCATAICARYEKLADAEGAPRTYAYRGYTLTIDEGVTLTILNPPQSVQDQTVKKTNNAGLVIKMTVGTQSVLFTADVEASVEGELVRSGLPLDSDFLKIGHHGSKTSTTQEFLDAVTPDGAFIEVGGRNTYGHPHPTVLERLANMKIPVYRTDSDGLVELILDGTTATITKHGH